MASALQRFKSASSQGFSFMKNKAGSWNNGRRNQKDNRNHEESNSTPAPPPPSKASILPPTAAGAQKSSRTGGESPARLAHSMPPPAPTDSVAPKGLFEKVVKNIQDILEQKYEIKPQTVVAKKVNVYMSEKAGKSDRLIILIGDSEASPAGLWSRKHCTRSSGASSNAGGIREGGLGSMLPFVTKTKKDKMSCVIFDDIYKGCKTLEATLEKFIIVWEEVIMSAKATHVFIVAYGGSGKLLLSALQQHLPIMQRQLSGIAFIQSRHKIKEGESYPVRKLLSQWAVHWKVSTEKMSVRLQNEEETSGCICLSSGCEDELELLQRIVPAIFASFKARWSGFRVSARTTGDEGECYLCQKAFTIRRWRRHCRTCQNAVCENCSSLETIQLEGQIRLCLICAKLPSLVQHSRPRSVRTGDKASIYEDSMTPGKMGVLDFELLQVIGKGACGKVLLVQKKEGPDAGTLYAMKILKKDWVLDKDLVKQTMGERNILQKANHPYIVQLRYAFQNSDKLYMVMDYYRGGSLRHVLRKLKTFDNTRAQHYLAEIVLAIEHLHSSNIIYRDLKLENVVMDAEGHVACTDFGLSKEEMSDSKRTKSFVGTCEYLAPELIKKTGYGKAVDWWALGILAYEMIQGHAPFRHPQPRMLFEKIVRDQPEFTDKFTSNAQDLILRLLNKNPEERLGCDTKRGASAIKQHAFFAHVDWRRLKKRKIAPPPPPHTKDEVVTEAIIKAAVAKARDAREEIVPDSPVAAASPSLASSSSSSSKHHFDRFTYQGFDDWHPDMAKLPDSALANKKYTIKEEKDKGEREELEEDEQEQEEKGDAEEKEQEQEQEEEEEEEERGEEQEEEEEREEEDQDQDDQKLQEEEEEEEKVKPHKKIEKEKKKAKKQYDRDVLGDMF